MANQKRLEIKAHTPVSIALGQNDHISMKPLFKKLSQHHLDKCFSSILNFAKMRNYYFRKLTEKCSRFREEAIMTTSLAKKRLPKKQFKTLRTLEIEPWFPNKESGFLEYLKIANCLKALRVSFGDDFSNRDIHDNYVRGWINRFPKSINILREYGKGGSQGAVRIYCSILCRLPKIIVSDLTKLIEITDLSCIEKIEKHLRDKRRQVVNEGEGNLQQQKPFIVSCGITTSILFQTIFTKNDQKKVFTTSPSKVLFCLALNRTYYQFDFDHCKGLKKGIIHFLQLDFFQRLVKIQVDLREWVQKDLFIIDNFGLGFGHLTNLQSLEFKLAVSEHWTARHTENLITNFVRIPAKLKKFKFKTPTMMSENQLFLFLPFFKNQTELINLIWKFTGPWDQLTSNFWQCFAQSFLSQYLANLKKLKQINLDLPLPLNMICDLLTLAQLQLEKFKLKAFDFETYIQSNGNIANIPQSQSLNTFFNTQKDTLKELNMNYKVLFSNSLFHLRNALEYLTSLEKLSLKLEINRQKPESELRDLDAIFLHNFPNLVKLQSLKVHLLIRQKDGEFSAKHRLQFLQSLNQITTLKYLNLRGILKDLWNTYPNEMEILTNTTFRRLSSLELHEKDLSEENRTKATLYSLYLLCHHEFS